MCVGSQSFWCSSWKMKTPVISIFLSAVSPGWEFLNAGWLNPSLFPALFSAVCKELWFMAAFTSMVLQGQKQERLELAGRISFVACCIESDCLSICLCGKSQSARLGSWVLSHSFLADRWFTESIKMPGWPRAQFSQMKPVWQQRGYFSPLANPWRVSICSLGGSTSQHTILTSLALPGGPGPAASQPALGFTIAQALISGHADGAAVLRKGAYYF